MSNILALLQIMVWYQAGFSFWNSCQAKGIWPVASLLMYIGTIWPQWVKSTASSSLNIIPDSKVHGDSMWPIWGRQDPGGPHVDLINLLSAMWSKHQNLCIMLSILLRLKCAKLTLKCVLNNNVVCTTGSLPVTPIITQPVALLLTWKTLISVWISNQNTL